MLPDNPTPRVHWSPVREVQRLVARHARLLALEYSPAGWKTTLMIEERLHTISDRLLLAFTPYPSLRWLLDRREVVPTLDLRQHPDLEAVTIAFDYFETLRHPDDPRRAVPGP